MIANARKNLEKHAYWGNEFDKSTSKNAHILCAAFLKPYWGNAIEHVSTVVNTVIAILITYFKSNQSTSSTDALLQMKWDVNTLRGASIVASKMAPWRPTPLILCNVKKSLNQLLNTLIWFLKIDTCGLSLHATLLMLAAFKPSCFAAITLQEMWHLWERQESYLKRFVQTGKEKYSWKQETHTWSCRDNFNSEAKLKPTIWSLCSRNCNFNQYLTNIGMYVRVTHQFVKTMTAISPWPCGIFFPKFIFGIIFQNSTGVILGMVCLIDVKQNGSASVGYLVSYLSLIFHPIDDLGHEFFKVKFQNSYIVGRVVLIDVKRKKRK